jgi:hypothetical protein
MNAERFTRFAVADWSGAKGCSHPGIALAVCEAGSSAPHLIAPPAGRYWSRLGLLDWLVAQDDDLLIGFDFSFAPPIALRGSYFPGDDVPVRAKSLWHHVDMLCEDPDLGAASFVEVRYRRHFYFGAADGTKADYIHLRRCEARYNDCGGGKPSSIYDAIGAAQVAKASFAGMRLLYHASSRLPIWPMDRATETGPLIVEIYTRIAAQASGLPKGRSKIRDGAALDLALTRMSSARHDPLSSYSDHATDALLGAAWLRRAAPNPHYWAPSKLSQKIATTEGWTFGII